MDLVKKKYLIGVLTSPLALLPILGGATCAAAGLACGALEINAPVTHLLLAGFGSAVLGFGIILQRLLFGCEPVLRRAQEEAETEIRGAREAVETQARQQQDERISRLAEQLAEDNDPGTDDLLRDLIALHSAFMEKGTWSRGINEFLTGQILQNVDSMFWQCIESLEGTLELYRSAQRAAGRKIRSSLLKRRGILITSVQQAVEKLRSMFDEIQDIGSAADQTERITRIGKELTMVIEATKAVDRRQRGLDGSGMDRASGA